MESLVIRGVLSFFWTSQLFKKEDLKIVFLEMRDMFAEVSKTKTKSAFGFFLNSEWNPEIKV